MSSSDTRKWSHTRCTTSQVAPDKLIDSKRWVSLQTLGGKESLRRKGSRVARSSFLCVWGVLVLKGLWGADFFRRGVCGI